MKNFQINMQKYFTQKHHTLSFLFYYYFFNRGSPLTITEDLENTDQAYIHYYFLSR